uniref:Uncharacterized protein n=1 Tax=Onchocerca volvulus TaxID=6282 RepID=A0A8R1XWI9_ONCVO
MTEHLSVIMMCYNCYAKVISMKYYAKLISTIANLCDAFVGHNSAMHIELEESKRIHYCTG